MRRAEEAEELEPRAHAIRANQAGSNADSLEPVVCVNLVPKKTAHGTKPDTRGLALTFGLGIEVLAEAS